MRRKGIDAVQALKLLSDPAFVEAFNSLTGKEAQALMAARAATIEAAARKLLEALPRCGRIPDDGPLRMCGKLALYQESGPAYEPYLCEEHRLGPDEVQWADAARELAAALEVQP